MEQDRAPAVLPDHPELAGRPLTSHDVIINTIAATTTATGLAVTAVLDTGRLPHRGPGQRRADDRPGRPGLTRHAFHGDWNYTLAPVPRPAPAAPPPAPGPAAAARAAVAPAAAALASPELTGLSRRDLAALAASLDLARAAAREQRLHLDRGHSRRTRAGPAAPYKYPLHTQLLAAIYHHRHRMPYTHIAALLGARYSTIAAACQAVTALLGPGHPALAPGPARLRTPADLRDYAATAGITIPDPPRADVSANSTIRPPATPETQLILECLHGCPDPPRKPDPPRYFPDREIRGPADMAAPMLSDASGVHGTRGTAPAPQPVPDELAQGSRASSLAATSVRSSPATSGGANGAPKPAGLPAHPAGGQPGPLGAVAVPVVRRDQRHAAPAPRP